MNFRRWIVATLITASCGGGMRAESGDMAAAGPEAQHAPGAPPPTDDAKKPEEREVSGAVMDFADEGGKQAPKPKPTEQNPAPGQQTAAQDPSRKQPILIYKADFSLSVYEVGKSLDAVEGLAKGFGGYLSRRDDRSITVRVPAEKFQDLVAGIEKVGDVLHRNVSSEDVTAEYRDLEVQLQNLTALRLRFEKLLEKAQKIEDALAVERELGRITGEIERIKGRLKLLNDLSRYSTITVTFEPHSSQQLQQGPFVLPLPWLNQTSLKRLLTL